jgi:hypothetical protein
MSTGEDGTDSFGTDFGVVGRLAQRPAVDEEPTTIEDGDDPDAIAHRPDHGAGVVVPGGVGSEVRPGS